MEKIITLLTSDSDLAINLQSQITDIINEHVNCTWFNGSWVVSACGEANEIEYIAEEITKCENYTDGKINIMVENAD